MNAPFNSRELSWLDFNLRVFEEAEKDSNPPLEQLKFLAITASNLDEFFMVRVAYLREKSRSGKDIPDDAGITAAQQLEQVLDRTRSFQLEQLACLERIRGEMKQRGIRILDAEELQPEQRVYLDDLFRDEIFPVLTPLAIDPSRPFPFLNNKALNLGVRLRGEEGEDIHAILQLPSILPRFIRLPSSSDGREFLPLETLIAHNLPLLFDALEIVSWGLFRVTRGAEMEADDDADDLLEEMIRTVKKRKRSRPVRLELAEPFDEGLYEFLRDVLGISKRHVFHLPGLLDLNALSKIAFLPGEDALRLPPITPVEAADFVGYDDIFAAIRERDRMVHHPYQSFDHVLDFINAAVDDPDVLAIKQTLYRVSGQSQVIAALERAAEAGKAVTVLVELKARFDEENNIQWAKRLDRAGCHVIYGLSGLKTHCKITLVVRKEPSGIRRYLHLGTGNYNDSTARLYTDIGMFTCRTTFGADASSLFNHLTGFSRIVDYHRLVAAPEGMRSFLLQRIDREIANAGRGEPSGIYIKINSLLDGQMIRKLYEASNAGVPVRLLVRGICCLVPGVEGYSENIQVHSIVGQMLEHSRIFRFENGGDPLYYMGSADLMPRNLDRRVELLFPVEEPVLKERLNGELELLWEDNTNTRVQGPDKVYRPVERTGKRHTAQVELARLARQELQEAKKEFSQRETRIKADR